MSCPPRGPGPVAPAVSPAIALAELEHRFDLGCNMLPTVVDYIVVGSGASGCAFAANLRKRLGDVSILVLEAGAEGHHAPAVTVPSAAQSLWKSEVDWGYTSTPQRDLSPQNRRMELEQGRTTGGSSALNYMVWVRGCRADFDSWVNDYGCGPEWDWDCVEQHFAAVEAVIKPSVQSPASEVLEKFVQAAESCGVPRNSNYNGITQEGVAPVQTAVDVATARRRDAFSLFLEPMLLEQDLHHPYLFVCSSAFVRRVVLDDRGDIPVAVGVKVADATGQCRTIRCRKEVVLAAGALGTPQLLLLSGIGPPDELVHHGIPTIVKSVGVGKGLQDHGVCPVSFTLREPLWPSLGEFGIPGIAFFRSDVESSKEHARDGPDIQLVFTAMGTAAGAPKRAVQHAEQVLPAIKSKGVFSQGLYNLAVLVGRFERWMWRGPTAAASIDTVLNRPISRGTVALRSSNPEDHPLVNGQWLSHPDDVRSQVAGLRKIREILTTEPLKTIILRVEAPKGILTATDAELAHYVRTTQQSTWHYSCTARMGDVRDPQTVCDSRGRVCGLRGLRICDCSLMPTVVSGNTYATALMLGHKVANHCADDATKTTGHARGVTAKL